MENTKLISIILVMISPIFSESDLLSEIINSSVVELNGIRDTLFEKQVKHTINDYAHMEINDEEKKVESNDRLITKREVYKSIFSSTFIDCIKNGIDSVNLIENSEYYVFEPKYILTIGSIKSWYTILFGDLKESIGYINYGDRVYRVYFDSSTISLIESKTANIIIRNNRIKSKSAGEMKNPASN